MIEETITTGPSMNYPHLAKYFNELIGDNMDRIVADSEVGRTTVYNIRQGKRARPENYEKLALAIGRTRIEQREIYKTLMRLSGYLDLLPADDSAIDTSLDALVLEEIKRRFPEIYAAAVTLVDAQQRGGQGGTTKGVNQKGPVEQGQ
jgi:hypothetical protein